MLELSLHIMDIVENSVRAGADVVAVSLTVDTESDTLQLGIADNGSGMDPETAAGALDPFMTTKKGKKTGLGLSLLRAAAVQTGGGLTVDSVPGKGTVVEAEFGLSHIDRQPLGSLVELMLCLLAAHPEVEFQLSVEKDGLVFEWDTGVLYERFDCAPRTAADVRAFIRSELEQVAAVTL